MFDSYNWIARFCPDHHHLLSTTVSRLSAAVFFTLVGFSPAKYSLANFSQASISRIDSSLTSDLTRELELWWKRVHIPSTTFHTRNCSTWNFLRRCWRIRWYLNSSFSLSCLWSRRSRRTWMSPSSVRCCSLRCCARSSRRCRCAP